MQGKIYNCADQAEREEGMALAVQAAKSGRLVVIHRRCLLKHFSPMVFMMRATFL